MKSLIKQLEEQKGKVVWLASYPKSGNTWFRCILSALFTGKVDINRINTDGIFSSRYMLDTVMDSDSRLFSEDEIKQHMATVYKFHSQFTNKLEFTKVHDAYAYDIKKKPIFPHEVSLRAFYIVRNPLDIVASFANHLSTDLDTALKLMNSKKGYLAKQANGLNINGQTPQLMFSWSGHVESWLDQKRIPVTIIRYEDLKKAPVKTVKQAMDSIGINISRKKISEAVNIAKFDKLKSMEQKQGFREKAAASQSFFRKGKMGGWKEELNKDQIASIIENHKKVMHRLGYLK